MPGKVLPSDFDWAFGDQAAALAHFKKAGQLPLMWQMTARELIVAANLLRRNHDRVLKPPKVWTLKWWSHPSRRFVSRMPVLVLYGLALENLVKGLLVAQGTDATSTGELNHKVKTHNLRKLFEKADLSKTPTEERLLDNLTWCIESGKYPVGTKPAAPPAAPAAFDIAAMRVDDIGKLLDRVDAALVKAAKGLCGQEPLLSLGMPTRGKAGPGKR